MQRVKWVMERHPASVSCAKSSFKLRYIQLQHLSFLYATGPTVAWGLILII